MSESKSLVTESINRIFADAVERPLLERFEDGAYPQELWNLVEQSGFHRLLSEDPAPEGWDDAEPVLRALGFHRAPLPLAETMVGNWLLAKAGLPVEDGPVAIAQCDKELQLQMDGGQLVLQGEAARVAWGSRAKRLVVAGTLGRDTVIGVLPIEQKNASLSIEHGANIALEPRDTLTFERVPLAAHAAVKGLDAQPALTYGALARAAAMAGAIESILEQGLQYANDRIQFGKPIGKFQAIQHQLAEVGGESAAADTAVTAAIRSAGTRGARLDVAAAKVRTGAAALVAARVVHQVHGAIGFTYEHTLQYATRRLWSWRNEFGNDAYWAKELGVAVIRRGPEKFWPDLTAGR